jgi:hypothetical protein
MAYPIYSKRNSKVERGLEHCLTCKGQGMMGARLVGFLRVACTICHSPHEEAYV